MTLDDLKRLRADLGYVKSDVDGKLTDVQSYHLALAMRRVRDEIVRLEAQDARLTRMVGTPVPAARV